MRRGFGVGVEPVEGSEDVIRGGGEQARGLMVERDVEVDAPFQLGHGFGAVGFRQRMGQIQPSAQGAVGGSLNDLMQVGVIGERLEGMAGLGGVGAGAPELRRALRIQSRDGSSRS